MTMPEQKPGRSRQDYTTPAEFLAAVKHRFGITQFVIDLAADETNAVADQWYDRELDALQQPWAVGEGWNWLNPEFGDIEPWVRKAYEQMLAGAQTLVLVPAGVGSNWWAAWVHEKAGVLLLNGRLCFIKDWATTIDPASVKRGDDPPRCYSQPPLYPKDCCLLVYSALVETGYDVWSWREEIPGA